MVERLQQLFDFRLSSGFNTQRALANGRQEYLVIKNMAALGHEPQAC